MSTLPRSGLGELSPENRSVLMLSVIEPAKALFALPVEWIEALRGLESTGRL